MATSTCLRYRYWSSWHKRGWLSPFFFTSHATQNHPFCLGLHSSKSKEDYCLNLYQFYSRTLYNLYINSDKNLILYKYLKNFYLKKYCFYFMISSYISCLKLDKSKDVFISNIFLYQVVNFRFRIKYWQKCQICHTGKILH